LCHVRRRHVLAFSRIDGLCHVWHRQRPTCDRSDQCDRVRPLRCRHVLASRSDGLCHVRCRHVLECDRSDGLCHVRSRDVFGLDGCHKHLKLLAPLTTRLLLTVFRGVQVLLGHVRALPPQLSFPHRQCFCHQLHVRTGLLRAGRGALHGMPLRDIQEGPWRVHSMPYRTVVGDSKCRCCGLSGSVETGRRSVGK
jgi:hypothetical protein